MYVFRTASPIGTLNGVTSVRETAAPMKADNYKWPYER